MDQAVTSRVQGGLPVALTNSLAVAMPHAYKLLPSDVAEARFRAALILHLQQSPKVLNCDATSILKACVQAATDGLLPGMECFFLPFKGEVSYVRHYHGLVKILERTGKVKKAFAHPVYQGDTFDADYFADKPTHIPYMVLGTAPGPIRFYYGAVVLHNGVTHYRLVSLEYIEGVRQRAPGGEHEAWRRNRVEMSCKTALKYTCQFVQLTPEVGQLLADEDAIPPAPPTDAQQAENVRDLWPQTPWRPEGGREPRGSKDESPAATPADPSPEAAGPTWGRRTLDEETLRLPVAQEADIELPASGEEPVPDWQTLPDHGWRKQFGALMAQLPPLFLGPSLKALHDPSTAPGYGVHLLQEAERIVAETTPATLHEGG